LAEAIFENLEIEDLQLVDDSFAPFDDSEPLKFRLSAPDLFAYNRATLNATYLPLIDLLAATLIDNESWQVEVSGHTDDTGPAPGNQRLSEGRAASAAQRLIDQGVPVSRVSSIGLGEDQPVATNDTEAGRLANRRVEFLITR
jgi:outer membrane protein OmpA-like peptidoglycan-associated protein